LFTEEEAAVIQVKITSRRVCGAIDVSDARTWLSM